MGDTTSGVTVSHMLSQLDTFAGLAAYVCVGSVRAVSSSVRAVGGKGKRPLRVGATPVPHAEILDFVREQYPAAGRSLRELAELTGRTQTAVRRALDKLGIPKRERGAPRVSH